MLIYRGHEYRVASRALKRMAATVETEQDTYASAQWTANGRVVCEHENPKFEQTGMRAYDMSDVDPGLEGYYGVHIGDPDLWLPTLYLEGDCDAPAYVYTVDVKEQDFFIMDDPHPMQGGGSSWILFSKHQIIPASMISLEHVFSDHELQRMYSIDGYAQEEIIKFLHENTKYLQDNGVDVNAITDEQLIYLYNDLCDEQPDCGEMYEAPVMGGRPSGPLVEGYEDELLELVIQEMAH